MISTLQSCFESFFPNFCEEAIILFFNQVTHNKAKFHWLECIIDKNNIIYSYLFLQIKLSVRFMK